MRKMVLAAAFLAASACTTTQDGELAANQQSNARAATADAQKLARGAEPDPEAQCIVFLGISRHHKSTRFDLTEAAMASAQAAWKAKLRQTMSRQEMDQLTGSSVNILAPADPATRDAASRWCVQNAPRA